MKVRFTDTAVASMGGTISLLMGAGARALRDRPGPMANRPVIDAIPQQQALPESTLPIQPDGNDDGLPHAPTTIGGTAGAEFGSTEQEQLHRIFRHEGDKLHLDERRLKPKSQADFVRRVTYLFLYAHYLENRSLVPLADLWAVLTDAGINDNNAKHWVRTSPDLAHEADMVALRLPGRDQAKEVLQQVTDPSYAGTWTRSGNVTPRTGRSAVDEEGIDGQAKSGRRKGNSGRQSFVSKWLAAWSSLGLSVNGHAAINDRNALDKGLEPSVEVLGDVHREHAEQQGPAQRQARPRNSG